MPDPDALAIAAGLALVAVWASAQAWSALFNDLLGGAERVALRGTFYASQLMKYLPAGGVIQTLGQIGLAKSVGVPLARSSVAFPVSVIGVSVGCAALGSMLALNADLPEWLRLLALCGLLSPIALDRRILAWILNRAHRLHRRIPGPSELPRQRDILAQAAWASAAIAGSGVAYAVLLSALGVAASPAFVIGAFALAWLAGFVAVPLPAGVGVREAALLLLLPGVATPSLLAAALSLRLVGIGAEIVMVGLNRLHLSVSAGRPS